jgi:hypothetical protein
LLTQHGLQRYFKANAFYALKNDMPVSVDIPTFAF